MYRKPRRQRKPRPDSSTARMIMQTCALAVECGFQVLAAHEINAQARIVIVSHRAPVTRPGETRVGNLVLEWRK